LTAVGQDQTWCFSGWRDGFQGGWRFACDAEVEDELVGEGGIDEAELFEEPEDALGLGVLGSMECW